MSRKKHGKCATEGCDNTTYVHVVYGGIGSYYCFECEERILRLLYESTVDAGPPGIDLRTLVDMADSMPDRPKYERPPTMEEKIEAAKSLRAAMKAAPAAINLEQQFRPMKGYDKNQSGYDYRRGWNDAIQHVMDLQRAAPPIAISDEQVEHEAFHDWWEKSGHAAERSYTLTTQNACHAAWQARAALSATPRKGEGE